MPTECFALYSVPFGRGARTVYIFEGMWKMIGRLSDDYGDDDDDGDKEEEEEEEEGMTVHILHLLPAVLPISFRA